MSSLRERSTVPSASRLTTSSQQQLAQAEIQLRVVSQGMVRAPIERGVGQSRQLLSSLFADTGVISTLFQLYFSDA